MYKTKEIQASCKGAYAHSEDRLTIMGKLEEPDIDHVLEDIHIEDLSGWLQDNKKPGDIFTEKQLSEWAEDNGYIKE